MTTLSIDTLCTEPSWDEAERLTALARYGILDTEREPSFDALAELAADIFDAPIAVVNLIADGRQWFKAEVGIGQRELPLDVSICRHAILQPGIFVVPDLTQDARFASNPLVEAAGGLRFYAGALLETPEGLPLGTVCVLDTKPRAGGISPRQERTLRTLALQVMELLERRRTETELRGSEERLRLATEHAEIGFWDVDEVNQRLIWPPRVKAMFGISADVPVTMDDFYAGIHPEEAEATAQAYAAAADPVQRALYDVEYRTVGKEDGLVRWVHAKGRGIFDENGRCLRVVGTAIEISARKKAEERLRELNDTLESQVADRTAERDRMWNTSPDLMLVIDFEGYFRRVNPAWTELLGYEPHELIDHHVNEFVLVDDHDETVEAYELAAEGGRPKVVNRYRHRDGSVRYISWVAAPAAGLTYATGRDVTADRERAAELALAQEALRQSQKLEGMGQLTGGVAHDFNNLLTPIIGSLDMLQRRGIGGERDQRLIDGALQSAERAKTLVQRLLAFARRQPLQPVPVDVASLIEGMADLVASTSGPQVKVTVDLAPEMPAVKADPNQLEMAVLNLAVNARDAMPDGGRLTISAKPLVVGVSDKAAVLPGRYVRLTVADTGVGMDEGVLARATEPFFSTKGIGKGTGLGLSMVHGLAAQLGGALTIRSKVGLGTSIDLWLPVTPEEVAGAASSAAEDAPQTSGTVLLVDDEAIVRMTAADMLVDLGYRVVEVESAEAAMRLLETGTPFDLVITDHLMPGMKGTDLARAVRTMRPGTPVLIISGYAETEGVPHDVPRLTKPFRRAELAAIISPLQAGFAQR